MAGSGRQGKGDGVFRQFFITILALVLVVVIAAVAIWVYRTFFVQPVQEDSLWEAEAAETQESVDYQAENEIRTNLRNLTLQKQGAEVITQDNSPGKRVALTIDGMTDEETMFQLLSLVAEHDIDVTFFISGTQALESPRVVKAIQDQGHTLGNYSLTDQTHQEERSAEDLVVDFTYAQKIITQLTGQAPTMLKCNVTQYTEPLLRAAAACGLEQAVESSHYLTYHSFRSLEDVQAYVNRLPYQSIVSIKLSGKLDPSEYVQPTQQPDVQSTAVGPTTAGPTAEASAVPSTVTPVPEETEIPLPTEEETLTASERLLRLVDWLLTAVDETTFSPEVEALRVQNDGALAEEQKGIYTTEAAVAYVFYGLGRAEEVQGVLNFLSEVQGVGTFFVSSEEIEAYPEQVASIIANGNSLGMLYYPKNNIDIHSVCHELLRTKELLADMGYANAHMVMQAWGQPQDVIREAASMLSFMLVGYDQSLAREENREMQSPREVIYSIYKNNTYGFFRGRIICFRMNYFERSLLLEELLESLEGTRNAYQIKDASAILGNMRQRFTYPLPEDSILQEVKDKLSAQRFSGDLMEIVADRYIGNPDVNTSGQLPGFTSEEIRKLDKSGKLKNDDQAVFLTFDDWGGDVGITKLLAVLKKHDVKATFFVRTQYVPDNPSLLRAIAADGHEIDTHTDHHLPLAHDPEGKWRFDELSKAEGWELTLDIATSYQTLQSIVGDMYLENGRPVLGTIFRPPTLAMSRTGMEAVFATGVTYIVSGDYTTRDYQAESAEALFQDLRKNVGSGSIVIMHMSDNSIYTADALDLFFTYNEERPDDKKFTFQRLSDYLPPIETDEQTSGPNPAE